MLVGLLRLNVTFSDFFQLQYVCRDGTIVERRMKSSIIVTLLPLSCGDTSTTKALLIFRYCSTPSITLSGVIAYIVAVSLALIAGMTSETGEADTSRAYGLISGFQGSIMSTVVLY